MSVTAFLLVIVSVSATEDPELALFSSASNPTIWQKTMELGRCVQVCKIY